MIRIHLDTGPRRVAEANAGTWEQGRELALAYTWRIHMQTGPRRVAKAIAGTATFFLGEFDSCMSVGVACVAVGGMLRGSSDVSIGGQLDMFGTMKVE